MKNILAAGMLLLLPFFAGAAPIEITVEGQITASRDSSGAAFGLGAGTNTVLGRTITFQWLIDPTRAPTPTGNPTRWFDCPESGVGGVEFISATVSIAGIGTIDFGTIAAPTSSCDGVALGDGIFGRPDGSGTLLTGTSFQLISLDLLRSEDGFRSAQSGSTLVLYSDAGLPSNLLGLDDLGLLPTTGISGLGSISGLDQCFSGPEQCPAGSFSFFANYALTSLSVQTVPEPGSLALVAAAAIAAAWIRRRRRPGEVG